MSRTNRAIKRAYGFVGDVVNPTDEMSVSPVLDGHVEREGCVKRRVDGILLLAGTRFRPELLLLGRRVFAVVRPHISSPRRFICG